MSLAIRISSHGGPEVLKPAQVEVPAPGEGEIRIRQSYSGVNYIDVYHRTGLYAVPSLPCTLGMEGAGMVDALGPGVTGISLGDRVAYCTAPIGSYTELRNIPAAKAVVLPDGIDEKTAAAVMLKGLTAQYLLRRTFPVKPGDTVLVHAAAGGVGSLLCQWAKKLGAKVIGTAGSGEKAALARSFGADHCIVYTKEEFAPRVKELTGGRGVDVVYDSVGKATFLPSLDCIRPMGMMVTFGNASGPVPAFEPALLAAKGSLFLTRTTLFNYMAAREDLLAGGAELFEVLKSGAVKVEIGQSFPLSEAAEAHRALESRKTTGSTVLVI